MVLGARKIADERGIHGSSLRVFRGRAIAALSAGPAPKSALPHARFADEADQATVI
jgi:hypothetical protein